MKKKTLSPHYIILFFLCQVLCLFFGNSTRAISNSIIIDCPSEISPQKTLTCDISSNSILEINKITGNFIPEKLTLKNFTGTGSWTISNNNNEFLAESTSPQSGLSKIGTFEISATEPNATGLITIDSLIFSKKKSVFLQCSWPIGRN